MATETNNPCAELEAALAPLRAEHPGITNAEVAELLPEHLRAQLWDRALDRYFANELGPDWRNGPQ